MKFGVKALNYLRESIVMSVPIIAQQDIIVIIHPKSREDPPFQSDNL